MNCKKWVNSIQTAGYNCARTVSYFLDNISKYRSQCRRSFLNRKSSTLRSHKTEANDRKILTHLWLFATNHETCSKEAETKNHSTLGFNPFFSSNPVKIFVSFQNKPLHARGLQVDAILNSMLIGTFLFVICAFHM